MTKLKRRPEMFMVAVLIILILDIWGGAQWGRAQNPSVSGTIATQAQTAAYGLTVISATATANTQATLTIPAPTLSGYYNYLCYLSFNASNDNQTPTAATNSVTTSTNFNSFALKFSQANTVNIDYDWSIHWGTPGLGCVKSVSPTTATTFVSPAGIAGKHFTWQATYYQAP